MDIIKNISSWIRGLTEIGLSILMLGVVFQIRILSLFLSAIASFPVMGSKEIACGLFRYSSLLTRLNES